MHDYLHSLIDWNSRPLHRTRQTSHHSEEGRLETATQMQCDAVIFMNTGYKNKNSLNHVL
jgi:hypothetical protein